MENKKNKRKLFKRIGAIAGAVVVAIVAFCLPFLGKFKPRFNSKNLVASADSTISTFIGSYLPYSVSFFSGTSQSGFLSTDPILYISFEISNDGEGYAVYINMKDTPSSSVIRRYTYFLASANWGNVDVPFDLVDDVRRFINLHFSVYGAFDSSTISYVNISTGSSGIYHSTAINYYDVNGNRLYIDITCRSIAEADCIFYNNTYYFQSSLGQDYNNGYTAGYSQGYSSGENAGYSEGYSAGENAGYSEGYSAGETIGYNNGYTNGVETGGRYTFFSLISAVIDAPIQAFMGLFNFELLGINLAGFFTGLLTLAFIITIVRLVMP